MPTPPTKPEPAPLDRMAMPVVRVALTKQPGQMLGAELAQRPGRKGLQLQKLVQVDGAPGLLARSGATEGMILTCLDGVDTTELSYVAVSQLLRDNAARPMEMVFVRPVVVAARRDLELLIAADL